PEYSAYKVHQAFAPACHLGLLIPQPSADPYATYGSPPAVGYSHLTRATRLTQVWLEGEGYAYDVISDLDLHTSPSLLNAYQTVMIAGHIEYWSAPAYNGIQN